MTLKAKDVLMSLQVIGDRWKDILGPGAHDALARAKSMLQESMKNIPHNHRRNQASSQHGWGFRIDPDRPLTFRETRVDGLRILPDLLVDASWDSEPAQQPSKLNIALRLWCISKNVYFRDEWDAKRLLDEIDAQAGRVMLRVHFDLAEKGQPGPRHHVQIGGVQHLGEFSWFPEVLSVPRLVHMPMDLVLATELIAATFYKTDYDMIRREPSWVHCRKTSEEHLLTAYFQQGTTALRHGKSVMETLWNMPWQ